MSAVFKDLSDINSKDEFQMRAGIFGHCAMVLEMVSYQYCGGLSLRAANIWFLSANIYDSCETI